MGKVYTEADLAAAWESGYWNGTSHAGPLNDAAVAQKNPYAGKGTTPAKACKVPLKTEKGHGVPVKESAAASEPTPHQGVDPMPQTIKAPTAVRELIEDAARLGLKPSSHVAGLDWEAVRGMPMDEVMDLTESHGVSLADLVPKTEGTAAASPPAGYALAKGCSGWWEGPATQGSGWRIIACWEADTNVHGVELWVNGMVDLSLSDAVALAAALTSATAVPLKSMENK